MSRNPKTSAELERDIMRRRLVKQATKEIRERNPEANVTIYDLLDAYCAARKRAGR